MANPRKKLQKFQEEMKTTLLTGYKWVASYSYTTCVHMTLVNVFMRYYTVILVVSIPNVLRTIDKLVTQDLQP